MGSVRLLGGLQDLRPLEGYRASPMDLTVGYVGAQEGCRGCGRAVGELWGDVAMGGVQDGGQLSTLLLGLSLVVAEGSKVPMGSEHQ